MVNMLKILDFKKRFRKKFDESGWVIIAKNENLLKCSRYTKGRVIDKRKVVERYPGD